MDNRSVFITNAVALGFMLSVNMCILFFILIDARLYHITIGVLASFDSIFSAVYAITAQEKKEKIYSSIAIAVFIMVALFFFNFPVISDKLFDLLTQGK